MLNLNRDFPTINYPGFNDKYRPYTFMGKSVNAADIGNIYYGAIGTALGIPEDLLLWQAGAAQKRDHDHYSFIKSEWDSLFVYGKDEHYGDAPDDYQMIIMGIEWYKDNYAKNNIDYLP